MCRGVGSRFPFFGILDSLKSFATSFIPLSPWTLSAVVLSLRCRSLCGCCSPPNRSAVLFSVSCTFSSLWFYMNRLNTAGLVWEVGRQRNPPLSAVVYNIGLYKASGSNLVDTKNELLVGRRRFDVQ